MWLEKRRFQSLLLDATMVWDALEVWKSSLRDCLKQHKGSKLGLLKIDFRNAFNLVKRSHFVKAACEKFPAMSKWTEWCYGEASMLLFDHG